MTKRYFILLESEWEEVQSVNKLIAGNGIEITTATTGSTFTVDLAGGDDGLEFDGGKLKATLASESDYGVVKIGDGVVADNGVIKAKNTITVGENPPAINLKQCGGTVTKTMVVCMFITKMKIHSSGLMHHPKAETLSKIKQILFT